MENVLEAGAEWPGAVAVSGGADSLALLLLLADWAAHVGRPAPVALTVDHGLQPDSKLVARAVAAHAKRHGLTAHVLRWTGRKPLADVEAVAREARYRLMGDWCLSNAFACLYVAHSLEDQAETFLLRLMRGSGLDGLSAMTAVASFPSRGCENLSLARPLLSVSRAKLRGFLVSRSETWLEDKMNADTRFARVRLRSHWPTLQEFGFSAERIAAAAQHLGRARAALDRDTADLLAGASRKVGDCVLLDGCAIATAPEEIGLRALARVLMEVSRGLYRPRFERLERLFAAIRSGTLKSGRTLHGCCIRPASNRKACFGPDTICVEPERGRRERGRKAGNHKDFADVKLSNNP
jgi:tRNA(Ile)-lysidine synthase